MQNQRKKMQYVFPYSQNQFKTKTILLWIPFYRPLLKRPCSSQFLLFNMPCAVETYTLSHSRGVHTLLNGFLSMKSTLIHASRDNSFVTRDVYICIRDQDATVHLENYSLLFTQLK